MIRPGYLPGVVTGFLIALALACGTSSATQPTATALELPAATQARWPDCSLAGWTLRESPTRFAPPRGTLCGTSICSGLVRGQTDFAARRITVWSADPARDAVLAWEACNACRYETTSEIQDVGCA